MQSSTRTVEPHANLLCPRLVPWQDWDEWHNVKENLSWLIQQDVGGVKEKLTLKDSLNRGEHDMVLEIVEVRLNDTGQGEWRVASERRRAEELRLLYSSVVVRAVNGLTGFEQKTVGILPVSKLAREIGIPTWVVDIRHEAAHRQLPQLVNLRLATDFLLNHVWQIYWVPQAEHLSFLGGAYDQLLKRFKVSGNKFAKAAIRIEEAKAGRPSGAEMALSKAKKVGAAGAPGSVAPASSSGGRSTDDDDEPRAKKPKAMETAWGFGLSGGAGVGVSGGDEGDASAAGDIPALGLKESPPPGAPRYAMAIAAAANATAASDMEFSVSPTGVSWGIMSLLVGGAVVGGGKKRGHLIPSPRDRFLDPGGTGVANEDLAQRWINRWGTLLDVYAKQWKGFGAALLVRLVEVLLAGASRSGHPDCGVEVGESHEHDKTAEELRWQGQFIGMWVRHLLSCRWHVRCGDDKVKAMLGKVASRKRSAELAWDVGDKSLDRIAPLGVLRAACFPLRQLLARCRVCLETLSVEEARNPEIGDSWCASHVASMAGLESVCRSLEIALGESTRSSNTDEGDGVQMGSNVSLTEGEKPSLDWETVASERPDWRATESTEDGHKGDERIDGDGKGLSGTTGDGNAETQAELMELESFEQLLGLEGFVEASASVSPDGLAAIPGGSGVVGGLDAGARSGKESDTAVGDDRVRTRVVPGGMSTGLHGDRARSDGSDDRAWDFVEHWTPCAIGTLPGWSSTPLFLSPAGSA